MVGDYRLTRKLVIQRRNNNFKFIADIHSSYNALQFPLIFWKGHDGYCINIKQRDPATGVHPFWNYLAFQIIIYGYFVTGAKINKKVSSMDLLVYRVMIRCGQDYVILRCSNISMSTWRKDRKLTTAILTTKSTEAAWWRIHSLTSRYQERRRHRRNCELYNSTIASYVGSSRHMQEYIQYAKYMPFLK